MPIDTPASATGERVPAGLDPGTSTGRARCAMPHPRCVTWDARRHHAARDAQRVADAGDAGGLCWVRRARGRGTEHFSALRPGTAAIDIRGPRAEPSSSSRDRLARWTGRRPLGNCQADRTGTGAPTGASPHAPCPAPVHEATRLPRDSCRPCGATPARSSCDPITVESGDRAAITLTRSSQPADPGEHVHPRDPQHRRPYAGTPREVVHWVRPPGQGRVPPAAPAPVWLVSTAGTECHRTRPTRGTLTQNQAPAFS
jgi:hypothetical protein